MTDHHPTRHGSGTGLARLDSRSSDGHYHTGESSTAGSLRQTTPSTFDRATDRMTDDTIDGLGDDSLPLDWKESGPGEALQNGSHTRTAERLRRRNKNRSTGGFLLHDAVPRDRDQSLLRKQRNSQSSKPKPAPRTPDTSQLNVVSNDGLHVDRDSLSHTSSPRHSTASTQESTPEKHMDEVANRNSSGQRAPSLDVDATQIVHMALNLSESRRIASRRAVSRTTPPRLAPIPDRSSGSNLRQHYQQQRRSSRTTEPKLNPASPPRIPSGIASASFLQPAFDPGQDAQYRYYFSASTLARAQRAKEHLELMSQYRRLLETLPPLKPRFDRSIAASPPSSPITSAKPPRFGGFDITPTLGRKYNALQYIRNRKVRARERKVIDGEQQGFGDAVCVRTWVDKVYQRASLADTLSGATEWTLPPFAGADEPENQTSPDATSKAAAKVRRPRVDWFTEPCDMIADAYWLEQDNHKQLIEDREWRKIFPPDSELSRPLSKQAEEMILPPFPTEINEHADGSLDSTEFTLDKVNSDMSHTSAKERAKQKLHEIKEFSHRHGAAHSHDFLRIRKDSVSETSDSENDAKNGGKKRMRIGRSGTLSSNSNDLLEKQMLEMIAKEARERDLARTLEVDAESLGLINMLTPDRNAASKPSSRFHSRAGSLADNSDYDLKSAFDTIRRASPPRSSLGRKSADVQGHRRQESNKNGSLPTSPELRAAHGHGTDPIGHMALSPSWSRAGSPTRNPLGKIKEVVADKSEEAAETVEKGVVNNERKAPSTEFLSLPESGRFPHRRGSSLERRPTRENHKGHSRSGSLQQRVHDQGAGLRGMFKSPRIDTVLRGGVSKLGDMLWKKEASSESPPDLETTDESDGDLVRGRRRPSLSLSRRGSRRKQNHSRQSSKHFLDVMPQFNHAPVATHNSVTSDNKRLASPDCTTRQSGPLSTFDRLKPPPTGIRSSSPSPRGSLAVRVGDSDVSESDSHQDTGLGTVGDLAHRRSSGIEPPKFTRNNREASRQWSIADRSNPPERTRLSRREVARMQTLILSSGVKAMEVTRRAHESHKPLASDYEMTQVPSRGTMPGIAWTDISKLCPEAASRLSEQQVLSYELYPLAAQTLGIAIQSAGQRWQSSADQFTTRTSPELQQRIRAIRSRVADDLCDMTHKAADEADETSKDLALDQPLKVKHVVDVIEKMLRRRRRRFRWARRAMWLTVEWLLVGFMWYVWFVVMILRIFLGVGKGFWKGVKWLLWL